MDKEDIHAELPRMHQNYYLQLYSGLAWSHKGTPQLVLRFKPKSWDGYGDRSVYSPCELRDASTQGAFGITRRPHLTNEGDVRDYLPQWKTIEIPVPADPTKSVVVRCFVLRHTTTFDPRETQGETIFAGQTFDFDLNGMVMPNGIKSFRFTNREDDDTGSFMKSITTCSMNVCTSNNQAAAVSTAAKETRETRRTKSKSVDKDSDKQDTEYQYTKKNGNACYKSQSNMEIPKRRFGKWITVADETKKTHTVPIDVFVAVHPDDVHLLSGILSGESNNAIDIAHDATTVWMPKHSEWKRLVLDPSHYINVGHTHGIRFKNVRKRQIRNYRPAIECGVCAAYLSAVEASALRDGHRESASSSAISTYTDLDMATLYTNGVLTASGDTWTPGECVRVVAAHQEAHNIYSNAY
jgi:hypothetical protein